jgi:hypothetical protein
MMDKNQLGFGRHLDNPEAFISAVLGRYFQGAAKVADREDMRHEARVALFAEDQRKGDEVPENTSGYWWRAAAAVGAMLSEDYNFRSMFASQRKRPFSLYEASPDNPEIAAVYLEKQRREPDPSTDYETREWVEHWMGIVEGILLDNENPGNGERDLKLFELWLCNYSYSEILEHPENPGFRTQSAVENRLRYCIEKLRSFSGVDSTLPIRVGGHRRKPNEPRSGRTQDQRFADWYSDPENRKRHREKCRERMRKKRAAAKEARKAKTEESTCGC